MDRRKLMNDYEINKLNAGVMAVKVENLTDTFKDAVLSAFTYKAEEEDVSVEVTPLSGESYCYVWITAQFPIKYLNAHEDSFERVKNQMEESLQRLIDYHRIGKIGDWRRRLTLSFEDRKATVRMIYESL